MISTNTPSTSGKENWDSVIKPTNSWLQFHLRDLWRYRDLIFLFVRRDLVVSYKQTILGPLWHVLQPILSTSIFTIIFGKIAQIPTDGVPLFLFYLAGTTVWGFFSSCLTSTSNIFVGNAGIFGKVYFPRMTVPISLVISGSIRFLIQFCVFLIFYVIILYSGANLKIHSTIFYLPLLIVQIAALGLAVGLIVSSLVTKYRDLTILVSFATQLWMYASPVIYPVTQVPEKYRGLYMMNPVVSMLEWFKYSFFGVGAIQLEYLLSSWIITIILFFIGLLFFNRAERTFMDTV